jgi:hypothetical protein
VWIDVHPVVTAVEAAVAAAARRKKTDDGEVNWKVELKERKCPMTVVKM